MAEAVAKAAADTSKILVVDMVLLLLSKTMMKEEMSGFGWSEEDWKEPRSKKRKEDTG